MAAELASGFISLTVRMAKGGMADVTKEVKKAGTEGGKSYSDEFNKQVEKDVGKKIPDTIGKATRGGGIIKAAKEAADEFGKGFSDGVEQVLGKSGSDFGKGLRDGVKQAIEEQGGVVSSLDVLSDKISDVTTEIGNIGDAFGVGTTGIQDASKKVTDAIDGISTSVTSTKTAMEAFKAGDVGGGLQATVDALKGLQAVGLPEGTVSAAQRVADDAANARTKIDGVIGPLENLTKLAGPDSKLYAAGKKLPLVGDLLEFGIAAHQAGNEAEDFIQKTTGLRVPLSGVSFVKQLTDDFNAFNSAADNAQSKLDAALGAARAAGPPPAHQFPLSPGRRAGGGSIYGPGGPKSDIIPIWASAGEHVLSAADVAKMGGQQNVYKFRSMIQGFAGGGAVDNPDVLAALGLVGTPYSQAARNDCSGTVAQVINSVLGMSGSGLMSTKNAASWLAARGFIPGRGPAGTISVGWYDHGPNPNDGHMAMTLSNGQPAEAGGSHGNFLVGAGAKGADSPQFDQHMYLPTLFGEGPAGSSSVPSSGAGGSGGGGGGGGGGGLGPSGTFQPGSNPYAQLAAAEKQKQAAIANIFGSTQIGALGDIGMMGLKETLLPPGFSDPTQWKSVASAAALMHSIGVLSGNPQVNSIMTGVGGLMTGSGSAVTGFIPEPFGTLPMPGPQPQPGVPGFPGQPTGGGSGNVNIGTYQDNGGKKFFQGAQTEARVNASPQTKQLTRRVG